MLQSFNPENIELNSPPAGVTVSFLCSYTSRISEELHERNSSEHEELG